MEFDTLIHCQPLDNRGPHILYVDEEPCDPEGSGGTVLLNLASDVLQTKPFDESTRVRACLSKGYLGFQFDLGTVDRRGRAAPIVVLARLPGASATAETWTDETSQTVFRLLDKLLRPVSDDDRATISALLVRAYTVSKKKFQMQMVLGIGIGLLLFAFFGTQAGRSGRKSGEKSDPSNITSETKAEIQQ